MEEQELKRLIRNVLSPTIWKSVSQIVEDIRARKLLRERLVSSDVIRALEAGQRELWVERRDRPVPRTLGNPRGTRAEYKLRLGGEDQPEERELKAGDLVPVPV